LTRHFSAGKLKFYQESGHETNNILQAKRFSNRIGDRLRNYHIKETGTATSLCLPASKWNTGKDSQASAVYAQPMPANAIISA
jgi:hypothetical protein